MKLKPVETLGPKAAAAAPSPSIVETEAVPPGLSRADKVNWAEMRREIEAERQARRRAEARADQAEDRARQSSFTTIDALSARVRLMEGQLRTRSQRTRAKRDTPALPPPNDDRSASGAASKVDLLFGVPLIADFLGLTVRQTRHLIDIGALPVFKLPGSNILCARRSTLSVWLSEQEAKSTKGGA